jgi:parallel beta-helix repeat protein
MRDNVLIGVLIGVLSFSLLLISCASDLPSEPGAPGTVSGGGLAGKAISYDLYAEPDLFTISTSLIHLRGNSYKKDFTATVSNEVIYKKGYITNSAGEWEEILFEGLQIGNTNWLRTQAVVLHTIDSLSTSSGENYIVAYSCKKSQGGWDCHSGKWMIHEFVVEIGPECTVDSDCEAGLICLQESCTTLPNDPEALNAASACVEGSSCDDGIFCNGADTCDALGECIHAGNPCSGTCDEDVDTCVETPSGSDFATITECQGSSWEGWVDGQTYMVSNLAGSVVDGQLETCLGIGANNVQLFCAGAQINGDFSRTDDLNYVGIAINGHSGVSVNECNIQGFGRGIYALDAVSTNLYGNILSQNGIGLKLERAQESIVEENIVTQNSVNGVAMVESVSNTFSSNTLRDNQGDAGIYVYNSPGNIFNGNVVESNLAYGFYLGGASYDNEFINNRACSNSQRDVECAPNVGKQLGSGNRFGTLTQYLCDGVFLEVDNIYSGCS